MSVSKRKHLVEVFYDQFNDVIFIVLSANTEISADFTQLHYTHCPITNCKIKEHRYTLSGLKLIFKKACKKSVRDFIKILMIVVLFFIKRLSGHC